MTSQPYVAVFGGCNVDMSGKSNRTLSLYDSNPGEIHLTPGGVGRNIAANIALVGVKVELVTAFGDDDKKQMILSLAPKNLSFAHAFTFKGKSTGSYLVVLDADGEMHTAINDMKIMEAMDKSRIAERKNLAEAAELVVVDANLETEALEEIFSWEIRTLVDGVSAKKVEKFKPFLNKINVLKCNVLEAEALMDAPAGQSLIDHGEHLLKLGVEHVIITAGAEGAYLFSDEGTVHFKGSAMKVTGATGAGDAFCGMLAASLVEGEDITQSIVDAMAASRMVLKSDHSDLANFHREQWEQEKEEIDYDRI